MIHQIGSRGKPQAVPRGWTAVWLLRNNGLPLNTLLPLGVGLVGLILLGMGPGELCAQDVRQVAAEADWVWESSNPEQDAIWEFKDPAGWKFSEVEGRRVLSQFRKDSTYRPPHRSPLHMALIQDKSLGNFQMDCWLKSTHAEYGHRDVCLFFGYQAPDQFYYVHLASEMDPHANQIFLVNRADRVKISETTTPGTRWDDQWHRVRVFRDHSSGKIAIYFDDMETPIMTAQDSTLGRGRVGVGSFDDTADFRRIEIRAW